ncbi:MAG: CDP-glycerol glycerophosphotransferase family protein [bacterium]|jgi:CDP-glycerol glycerophosphotransferase (TagB/SpsB family)|nr:CDP-glycerol glycerophosphotransferase family protein [bacterium]
MNKINVLTYLLFMVILPLPLFAYLDPGSGSMLFSAVIGIVATLFFVIKGVFFKIIDLPAYFSGVSRGKRAKHSIVFYCEGPQYWNIFLPVIKELSSRNVKCTYLSSKENDPGLSCGFPNVETKFIGEGNKAFFYLNTLSADVCIMTTPGLDVLQIKRSKGVKKYIHIPHSTGGGCSGYATYGTDYYDAVLTGGDSDIEFIRELEQVRGLPAKELVAIGCTYMDVLREKASKITTPASDRMTILLSPTWGLHGLLRKYGDKVLTYLTNLNKYNIIVRPHPQGWISDKDLINELKNKFPDGEHLVWDSAPDGTESMKTADIMISDFSGIIFDFILLFEKPVLAFKGNYDKRGHDSMDIKEDPWVLQAVERTGISIEEKDVEDLESRINEKLEDKAEFVNHLEFIHNSMDKFPGESGVRGADEITRIAGS